MISHPGKERGEGIGEMSGEFGMVDNPIRGKDRVRYGIEMSDGGCSFGSESSFSEGNINAVALRVLICP